MPFAAVVAPPAEAKAPGVSHCYKRVCHRVKTIAETRALIGQTRVVTTSHYGPPGIDRFNRGTFTSNGERFHAGDPGRAASSDLPDGTELLIRNPANGRVSHVRINDFGPFRGNRKLDVTRRVAADLGFTKAGVVDLEVTVIAAPREADVPYRRNRRRIKAKGALGVIGAENMAPVIASLIAARAEPSPASEIAVAAAPFSEPAPNTIASAGTGDLGDARIPLPDNHPEAISTNAAPPDTPSAAADEIPDETILTAAPAQTIAVVTEALAESPPPPESLNLSRQQVISAVVARPDEEPAAAPSTADRESVAPEVERRPSHAQGDAARVRLAEGIETPDPMAGIRTSEAALWSLMALLTTSLLWTAGRARKQSLAAPPSLPPTVPLPVTSPAAPTTDLEADVDVVRPLACPSHAAGVHDDPVRFDREIRSGNEFARPLPPIELLTISFAPRRAPQPPT